MRRERAALCYHAIHRSIGQGATHRANRRELDDLSAADGLRPTALAEDEPITGEERERGRDADADPAAGAGRDGVGADDAELGGMLTRPDRDGVGAATRHVVTDAGEHGQLRVEHATGKPTRRLHHCVTSGDRLMLDPDEVDRDTVAGTDLLDRVVEGLQRADACAATSRFHDQFVVDGEEAVGQRAGHDRARSASSEHAVDPQSRPAAILRGRRRSDHPVERPLQLVDADAARCGDADHLRVLEERARDPVREVEPHQFEVIRVDEVDLGQRDHAVLDAQQIQDAEMLLALGLPTLGGRDDEKTGIHRTDAGEHVLDEADVTRHVDK